MHCHRFQLPDFTAIVAKNLMAKAYYRLNEIDASGAIVHTYWLGGNLADIDWAVDVSSSTNLRWAELNATLDARGNSGNGQFGLSIAFFLSNVIGKLNIGDTVMTPRSIESIIRITDYVYANATNKLVLFMAAAHGQSNFSASGDIITTGALLEQVYVQLAASCQVAASANVMTGENRAVVTSSWSSNSTIKDLIQGSDFYASINAKFNNNWDIRTINITFPANASNIIYDPTLGSGRSTAAAPSNTASAALPSLFLIAVAALFGIFYL